MSLSSYGERECDWCGAEITGRIYRDRIGGEFCSRTHRDQSTAAVKGLRERAQEETRPPRHDEVRNHRIERVPRTSQFDVQGRGTLNVTSHDVMTVQERYCAHCATWVECRGVTGALRFMALHDAGACDPKGASRREQNPSKSGLI